MTKTFDIDGFLGIDLEPITLDLTEPESDLVDSAEVGDWLGLTGGRIHQLARDGIIPRFSQNGQHLFPLESTVRAYCENTRSAAARRAADPEMAAEKLRLTRAVDLHPEVTHLGT